MILYDQAATAQTNPQGLIQRAWVAYKGNTAFPAPGSADYIMMVMVANRLQNNWAKDSRVHWDSLFALRTYGPVTATKQSYGLDDDVFYLSDWAYILRPDGNTDRFQVVHPEARNDYKNGIGSNGSDSGDPPVYLTGTSANGGENMSLNFVLPFQTNNNGVIQTSLDVGGKIQVGVYALPPEMVNPGDTVVVNDPEWLVWKLAAEMARNDPAKEDRYADLVGEANVLYQQMVLDNQGNSFQQPNSPSYVLRNPGVTWEQT